MTAAISFLFSAPLMPPASAQVSPAYPYGEVLGEQLRKYSPDALVICDRASNEAKELITRESALLKNVTVIRALGEAVAALYSGGRSPEGQAHTLSRLTAVLINIKEVSGARGNSALVQDVEGALYAFERRSIPLPVEASLPDSEHLEPGPGALNDAKLIQALLSASWLALSQLRGEGLYRLNGPEAADARRLDRALRSAERAQSLVTPWCQPERFTLSYLEVADLTFLKGHRSDRPSALNSRRSLTAHSAAIRVLQKRVGLIASRAAMDRLRLSLERNTAWSGQPSSVANPKM